MQSLKYLLALLILAAPIHAQSRRPDFGCPEGSAKFFHDPGLSLAAFSDAARVREWQTRPALRFRGFAKDKYEFTEIAFFRWHEKIKGREGERENFNRDYEDSLALAVQSRRANLSGGLDFARCR
jgi:hypothetical protein